MNSIFSEGTLIEMFLVLFLVLRRMLWCVYYAASGRIMKRQPASLTDEAPELTLTKPVLKKSHLWLLNAYDCIYQTDTSAYPALKLADLLALPLQDVIKKHGIA
jgi:hypothetical protein